MHELWTMIHGLGTMIYGQCNGSLSKLLIENLLKLKDDLRKLKISTETYQVQGPSVLCSISITDWQSEIRISWISDQDNITMNAKSPNGTVPIFVKKNADKTRKINDLGMRSE